MSERLKVDALTWACPECEAKAGKHCPGLALCDARWALVLKRGRYLPGAQAKAQRARKRAAITCDALEYDCAGCHAKRHRACLGDTCPERLERAARDPIPPASAPPVAKGDRVRIVLPLPGRDLSPNGRLHWRAKSKKVAAYRDAARVATLEHVTGEPWERCTVRATFWHSTRRRRDDVNHLASLKPAYDGIVDAGLIEDDDAEHLTTLGAIFAIDRANPRVELLIVRVA